MSAYMYCIGFRPSPKHDAMWAVVKACEFAGVEMPDEVAEYFEGYSARSILANESLGKSVEIEAQKWDNGDMEEGLEIVLSDLPDDIEVIRVVYSH